jgi:hypothetical protein
LSEPEQVRESGALPVFEDRTDLSSQLSVSEAIDCMIVHHASCLHMGIADRRADEVEAAFS